MPEEKGCNSESSNVIKVPSNLSKTLKEWSEATIRTQPLDLLRWSAVYFRMSANGEHPPVKPYLDTRDLELGPGGLTPNTLKVLAMSLSNKFESSEKIENLWSILSLETSIYFEIIEVGNFKTKYIKSIEFIGIAASYLNKRLRDTMVLLCDTLSDDYSNGIVLDTFVTVYKYLAMLNGAYSATDKSSAPNEDERVEGSEKTSLHSNSECFKSWDSRAHTDDDQHSVDCASKRSALNYGVSKSEEGIVPYQNDNMYMMEPSFAEALNELPAVEPPTNPCDDPDLRSSPPVRGTRPDAYDDELLSLLSGSSAITEHDSTVTSSGSWDDDDAGPNGAERGRSVELAGGETTSGSFLQPEDACGDEEDGANSRRDGRDGEHGRDDTIADEYDEANADDFGDDDAGENDGDYVPVNTDFIVMFALVDGRDGPAAVGDGSSTSSASAAAENGSADHEQADHESVESTFSLLEHSGLQDSTAGAEPTGTGDKPRVRTFDKSDHYTPVDRQSTDSDSDVSHEFQYSEIDQQSVESAPEVRSVDVVEANASNVMMSGDDADSSHHHSLQFYMDGPEETGQDDENAFDEYGLVENEARPYSRNTSAVAESEGGVESDDGTPEPEDVRVIHVLPGIGPPLPEQQIQNVIDWLTKCAQNQNGRVHEYNLLHYLCPPLDHHHHD